MSFIIPASKSDYEAPATGTHLAVAFRVIDLGTHEYDWMGETKDAHQVFIDWELIGSERTDGKPFTIGKFYRLSRHEKASLRLDLESWRGRKFTEAELDKFDLFESIIGKPCLLNIVLKEKGGVKVQGISPVPSVMRQDSYELSGRIARLKLDKQNFNEEEFNSLSDGLKRIVEKSPEYRALRGLSSATEPSQTQYDAPAFDDAITF